MNKIIVIWSLIVTGLFAQQEETFDAYLTDLTTEFDIKQVKADAVNLSTTVILDTREKNEFEVSRLKNAVWIGYDDFEISRIDSIKKDQEIIVYCSVGYRSSKIGEELIESGYKNVKNLYGGIFQWANENRPVYNDSTQTRKVHVYNRKWGRFLTNPDLTKIY